MDDTAGFRLRVLMDKLPEIIIWHVCTTTSITRWVVSLATTKITLDYEVEGQVLLVVDVATHCPLLSPQLLNLSLSYNLSIR